VDPVSRPTISHAIKKRRLNYSLSAVATMATQTGSKWRSAMLSMLLFTMLPAPGSAGAATNGKDLPSNAPAPVNCATTPPTTAPAENLKYAVVIDPHTIWRPVGGAVKVTVTGQNNLSISGLSIQTCFARRDWGEKAKYVAGGPITIDKSDGQRVSFYTTVPDLTKDDLQYYPADLNWLERNALQRWHSLSEDSSIIPITYVRVIGTGGPASAVPLDVLLPIGLTSVPAALVTTGALVALALALLRNFVVDRFGKTNFLLAIIATKSGTASLSQFQVLLWTFVVGASAVYVILLSGNLIDISGDVLTLLGITGVTLLGAQLPAAQATPAVANAGVAAVLAGAAPGVPAPALVPNPPAAHPRWSDLVVTSDGSGQIDVTRVQMFFFTVVSALFVLLKVFGNYAIPDLPSGYLVLMGISNGVYLANKFVPKS
jgi:hypothetical protein